MTVNKHLKVATPGRPVNIYKSYLKNTSLNSRTIIYQRRQKQEKMISKYDLGSKKAEHSR